MKRITRCIKKNWITVWLVMTLIILGGAFAYARYNEGHNVVKRVIVTEGEETEYFTSNYMSRTGARQIKSVNSGSTQSVTFNVSTYNFNVHRPVTPYPSQIEYTLSAEIMNGNGTVALSQSDVTNLIGTGEIYIRNASDSSALITLDSDTRSGSVTRNTVDLGENNGKGSDNFIVELPNAAKDKDICVKITATPTITSIQSLSGTFAISTQSFERIDGWSGSIADNTSVAITNYDGFNYKIEGSGNSSGTLTWNSAIVEPNKQQIQDLFNVDITGYTPDANYIVSIPIDLDADESNGRYDIQFYIVSKIGKTNIESMGWEGLTNNTTGPIRFVED